MMISIGLKILYSAWCLWLMPVILATQAAEIRRIMVQSQPGQIVYKTPSQKYLTKKRAGGGAQGVGPEFKPQYHTHTHKKNQNRILYLFLYRKYINHITLTFFFYPPSLICDLP
jgi:hypothetical protein